MNKMFLNIEAFMYTPGSRCLCPLTSPLSKNLVEMISSPTKEPNPRLSTDKGRENTDVMKMQLLLLPRVGHTVKYQSPKPSSPI